MNSSNKPSFTVVMPTRNRPELFGEALDSVLAQDYDAFDVAVINDGSDDEFREAYAALTGLQNARVRWQDQPQRPRGHGQSYSMNTGAASSASEYICFLDDDDTWTDTTHLSRLAAAITAGDERPDVIYTNQHAFDHTGKKVERILWIADRVGKAPESQRCSDGSFAVDDSFMLASKGFAHLNCTAIKRSLYLDMGGMDENIRYECDREFYLRTVDKAQSIRFIPEFIGRHNVPDPGRKDNMSTLIGSLEKQLYQVTVFQKMFLFADRLSVRTASKEGLAITYKNMSEVLQSGGNYPDAAAYAVKAQGLSGSLKWWLHTRYLQLRAALA